MSNSRRFRRQLVDAFGPLDGARIEGGCPDCPAYQMLSAVSAGVWSLEVFHEPGCPTLAAMESHR